MSSMVHNNAAVPLLQSFFERVSLFQETAVLLFCILSKGRERQRGHIMNCAMKP